MALKTQMYFGDPLKSITVKFLDIGEATTWGSSILVGNTPFGSTNNCVIRYSTDYSLDTRRLTNLLGFVTQTHTTETLYALPAKVGGFKMVRTAQPNYDPYYTIEVDFMTSSNVRNGYVSTRLNVGSVHIEELGWYPVTCTVNGRPTLALLAHYTDNGADRWAIAYQTDHTQGLGSTYDLLARVPYDPQNPYDDRGNTKPGGGDPEKQQWEDESDAVTDDPLPTKSAVSCGLVTIFAPTEGQMKHLSDVLWGKDFLSFVQNLTENISDLFISFGLLPFSMDGKRGSGVDITFFDWVVTLRQQATNIPMFLAADQFFDFDMGSIDFANDPRIHRTDSVFDYSPYSRLGIYLPFIGFQEMDIDEVRNSVIGLRYSVDILSGTCVAKLDVTSHDDGKTRTLYQFTGNCLTQLPLTSTDCQTMISNAVNLGIAAASAGATSAIAGAGGEFVESQLSSGKLSGEGAALRNKQFEAQVCNAEGSLASASANAAMGIKPNYKHSGAIGASGSTIAVKQPYLFITTPNEAVPEYYEKYAGLPSNITSRLGDLSGFTVVQDIRLNGLVATSPEVEEIYKLLKTGVII